MEHWDAELERRVWQRVRGEAAPAGNLTELVGLSRAQAEDLRLLDREAHRQEMLTLGLLAGLQALEGTAAVPVPPRLGGSRWQRLDRCLQRCRKQLQLMVALETHERYGPVFTALTRRQRAQCARLEALRGRR